MNILFVRPPDPFQHISLLSHTKPMNLAYLAAYMRREGFHVTMADFEVERYSDSKLLNIIREVQPSVVGVSSVTPTIRNAANICAIIKQYDSSIATVVGGSHANGLPTGTLEEFPSFDYVVYGEGEKTFAALCRRLAQHEEIQDIQGIIYRDMENIVRNPPRDLIADIDQIPFPARDLIRHGDQSGHSSRGFPNRIASAELFTSRGCPFPCTFCAVRATFGETVRFRKTSFIREEVGQMMRDYHFGHIIIADDTFTLKPDRAMEICEIFAGCGVPSWSCDTRVTHISRPLLLAMKASGCRKIAFGVESGSQQVLDRIGKRISVEQVRDAVMLAREAGIQHVEGNFIIGSDPDETLEDIAMTERLIMTLPWSFVSVSVIVPYPGTEVRSKMQSRGLISPQAVWEDYEMFGAVPCWRTTFFSAGDLIRLQKRLTRKFYLRPSYVLRQLSSIRAVADIKYWFSAGVSYCKWYFAGKI